MSAGQPPSYAALDAVTIDAYGTLLELVDPVPALGRLLRERGIERPPEAVERGFRAEVEYYLPRAHLAGDQTELQELWRGCAAAFLAGAGAELDPGELAPHYVASLEFVVLPGIREALTALRRRGLALAVVSNWDLTLPDRLAGAGLAPLFDVVVGSAELGVKKPDVRLFELAMSRLDVRPERALHIGDDEDDERGAAAAGMRFAPAPLPEAVRTWE